MSQSRPFRRLFSYAGNGRRMVLAGFALILLDAAAQMSAPAVFGVVLDRVQHEPNQFLTSGWQGPLIAAAFIGLTFFVAAYLAHTWTRRGAARWSNNLRRALYEHVQRLSLDFFHRSRVGDLAARINQDIERLEITVWQGLAVVWAAAMLVMAIAFIAWISLLMAGIALGLFGIAALWTTLVLPKLRRQSRAVRDELGHTSGTVAELLGVNALLKAFNAEDHALSEVQRGTARVRDRTESLARMQHRYSDPLAFHLSFVAPFVLVFVGAWEAAKGRIGIGAVVAIWGFWLRGSGALTAIMTNVPDVLAGLAASERAAELLDETPRVVDCDAASDLRVTKGRIEFQTVDFTYPSRPWHSVLDDFALSIHPGETVALVGPSGAGKSTIAQLLLRFYDPTRGRILVDGQDLRLVRQDSVRSAVGMVFQDAIFLSGSLERNLRLAKAKATDEELVNVLTDANAWGFVSTWEDGLETEIGERGVLLSGGQRQRLAIARVMLKDPSIVVLDEATSALDALSEREVLTALDRLMANRTSIVIAHRMATVRQADRIVVLDHGRVAAIGSHASLLRDSPIYQAFCKEQSVA